MFERNTLTWIEDSRPRQWILRVTFCIESNFEVEHRETLHVDPTKWEGQASEQIDRHCLT